MGLIQDKRTDAAHAASFIHSGDVVGMSGFTLAGQPKVVPLELAKHAEVLHAKGQEFQIALFTGASVGDDVDGALARAGCLVERAPYQSNGEVRRLINAGKIRYVDYHLSQIPQYFKFGFIPRPTVAVIEACRVTDDGKVFLTMSGGMSATYMQLAERIIIELNQSYGDRLVGLHDVYTPEPPPHRHPLLIHHPGDRIGATYVQVDPRKIVAIVPTDLPCSGQVFKAPDVASRRIAEHIVDFLDFERRAGRLPEGLPLQAGVGNVSNSVLSFIAKTPQWPRVSLYTEVVQDSIFDLLDNDLLEVASTCALNFSESGSKRFHGELDTLADRFVLRQQEMSNHPEVIRRLGVVSMNTALEFDLYGNVNSTHLMGSSMMNGIGGSGDFSLNAYLTIFMTPSTAKEGRISAVVPMVPHVDHNEHAVQVLVTEQGLADLRGLNPIRRAKKIIESCAHPSFRPLLEEYLEYSKKHGPSLHTPHSLSRAFEFHTRFMRDGTMLPLRA
jgi:succinyl-CoA:acetate CoA-transferase